MKVLFINSMSGKGSTGRIVDSIAQLLIDNGHEAAIAYGLGSSVNPNAFKFGTKGEQFIHKVISHTFDMQGLGSQIATRKLIKYIEGFKPDIINLHTIHGNYLNYPALFKYLTTTNIEIVWTLHDCWSFTGHCPHFAYCGCEKWRTGCYKCPQLWMYPKSDFWDGSKRNYRIKKKFFQSFPSRLHIVAVSNWLKNLSEQSILKNCTFSVFYNGIDLNSFRPFSKDEVIDVKNKYNVPDKKTFIAVAYPWSKRKGLDDLVQLNDIIDHSNSCLIIVGLNDIQIATMPPDIVAIPRTDNVEELAKLYSMSSALINPTYEDSFPTVNLEALACGTPVVTYKTGGSPEAITNDTGIVVNQGDIVGLAEALIQIIGSENNYTMYQCRLHAENHFNQNDSYIKYLDYFEELLSTSL